MGFNSGFKGLTLPLIFTLPQLGLRDFNFPFIVRT